MACYHPIPARQMAGRMKIKVAPQYATHWLPCGTCIGCREAQALAWTIRLTHESRSHSRSTFLTLTYDAEHEPHGLSKPDLTNFWKRLRKQHRAPIKYFAAGEYGDRTHRPHYHAAVFDLQQFPDAKRWDLENYTSETLNNIWARGRVLLSELTPHRIAYVTGYVLKKAGYRRQIYCDEDGVDLQPPFRVMSKGLGKEWLARYETDLRNGCVHHEGYKVSIPRYYQDRIKKLSPKLAEIIQRAKDERRENMEPPERARLDASEAIRHQQIKKRKKERI